jgi:hypothetical protein
MASVAMTIAVAAKAAMRKQSNVVDPLSSVANERKSARNQSPSLELGRPEPPLSCFWRHARMIGTTSILAKTSGRGRVHLSFGTCPPTVSFGQRRPQKKKAADVSKTRRRLELRSDR